VVLEVLSPLCINIYIPTHRFLRGCYMVGDGRLLLYHPKKCEISGRDALTQPMIITSLITPLPSHCLPFPIKHFYSYLSTLLSITLSFVSVRVPLNFVFCTVWTIRGSHPGRDQRSFSCPCRPDVLWGPLILFGDRGSSLWVKRPRSEAEHSPPNRLRLRMTGDIPPLHSITSWQVQGQI
jgi:hypothetical protein